MFFPLDLFDFDSLLYYNAFSLLPLLYLCPPSFCKVRSQLSANVFKSSRDFNPNELANFALNQFVKQVSG